VKQHFDQARRSALARWIAQYGMLLVVALVAGLATIARQQGVPRFRTIWAEDGQYLLMVLAEETRDPTKEQLKIFKDNGFSEWYTAQKGAATITYDIVSSSGAS